jgi:hypothetical protein
MILLTCALTMFLLIYAGGVSKTLPSLEPLNTFAVFTLFLVGLASLALLSLRKRGPLRLLFVGAGLLDAPGFTLLSGCMFVFQNSFVHGAFPWLIPSLGVALSAVLALQFTSPGRSQVTATPHGLFLRRVTSAFALGCLFAPIAMMACANYTLYDITAWSGGALGTLLLALAGYLAPLWSLLSHPGDFATPNSARTPAALTPKGPGKDAVLATGSGAVAL